MSGSATVLAILREARQEAVKEIQRRMPAGATQPVVGTVVEVLDGTSLALVTIGASATPVPVRVPMLPGILAAGDVVAIDQGAGGWLIIDKVLGRSVALELPTADATARADRLTVQADGTIAWEANVAFPATQVPSADPNTLDDYEEGTWVPTLSFDTPGNLVVVYSQQTAWYAKVGKYVSWGLAIQTSTFTHTTASGNFRVNGLPFTVASGAFGASHCTMRGYTKANFTQIGAEAIAASTNLRLVASGSAQVAAYMTTADVPTGGSLLLWSQGMYFV